MIRRSRVLPRGVVRPCVLPRGIRARTTAVVLLTLLLLLVPGALWLRSHLYDGTLLSDIGVGGMIPEEVDSGWAPPPADQVILVVASPPTGVRTGQLDPYLWAGLTAVLLAVASMTWWIAGRPLRTVEGIRREAEEITLADLDRRLPVPPGRDEVTALARTWNTALARLDEGRLRHRRFVADAAHELRSPITSLMTVIEVAQAYPTPERHAQALARAHGIGVRLQGLVDDLLLLARMDADEPLAAELVDLREVAARALRSPATLAPGAPVLVRGDRRHLQRAVDNLVDNAVRHASSRVELRCAADGGEVRLVVGNDGPPIAEADRVRVFERFVRLDEGRDRDSGGSGLGLAIVTEVARRHGGVARVLEVPAGAAFELSLPLAGGS